MIKNRRNLNTHRYKRFCNRVFKNQKFFTPKAFYEEMRAEFPACLHYYKKRMIALGLIKEEFGVIKKI